MGRYFTAEDGRKLHTAILGFGRHTPPEMTARELGVRADVDYRAVKDLMAHCDYPPRKRRRKAKGVEAAQLVWVKAGLVQAAKRGRLLRLLELTDG